MNHGIIGIKNRGNTCFLNTAIQCLNNIYPLSEYFLSDAYKTDFVPLSREHDIVIEYTHIIKSIWNHDSKKTREILDPSHFHTFIQRIDSRFSGYEQHDVQEFLSFLLDHLHEGLKYEVEIRYAGTPKHHLDEIMIHSINEWKKNIGNKYSKISDLFFGQFITKIYDDAICASGASEGDVLSKTFEMFSIFTLPIFGDSLYEAFDKYIEKEKLDTPYFDEKTGMNKIVYKEAKIMSVPRYFIITLKRYKNKNGYLLKSNGAVTFPIDDLNLSKYCEGYDSLNCTMRLISIGCHIGGIGGGHYYAVCRNIRNNKWTCFNDELINDFDMDQYKEILFKHAYILIYEKVM